MELDKTFKPTVEWMAAKYAVMNDQLFDGELGECSFKIFTTGRGMEGGSLGWFRISAHGIFIRRYNRRLFKSNGWDEINIDRNNFATLCQPQIGINGNYSGTEYGFLATLVHEMCHYYTFMNGYAPKQAHGKEFKEIGYIVSSRSNGLFTIQRLATAEEMSELELNDKMKAKREKRLNNKKASVTAIIVFTKNGKVKLTITSSQNLINLISTSEQERGENVITTNDANVIEFLFSKGYRKNMRTWRYWSLEDKPWLDELKQMLPEMSGQVLGAKRPTEQPQIQDNTPQRIFSIKTSNGTFEYDGSVYYSLKKALKERFPFMSDEALEKIIRNPANYRMVENKRSIKTVIKEVIDEFMQNEFRGANNMDDSVEINPNMNLGLQSPLEDEMY
jgi:hypothetical protein